ncbi:SDR family oxidoreductase [uncultured Xylophilus sp.]|uniref:SDR family NAD(P)-dependent oxidoreductase n=1 Tax=uncultured Xylophilus sp. TaxID=296832 RepID=UPI0025E18BD8|nr:SDR family oxidoreductase [uncultured Xylophilus sp.]
MGNSLSDGGRLRDRVVVVTGAAQGIGATYALALAKAGAKVVCADILDLAGTVAALDAIGAPVLGLKVDVTDASSVAVMVERTVGAFGRIDVLVNNAAIFGNLALKPFEQIGSDEWDKVMAVNVRGAFECAKAVAPVMRKQRYGKIINVASGTVFKGTPLFLHYVTSKGAIVAMSRCLARELGNDNICVNTLAPGLTLSANVASNPDWQGDIAAGIVSSRAIKRDQTPDDLTGTLIYLASADSDFVTGQTVVVDGGSVTH